MKPSELSKYPKRRAPRKRGFPWIAQFRRLFSAGSQVPALSPAQYDTDRWVMCGSIRFVYESLAAAYPRRGTSEAEAFRLIEKAWQTLAKDQQCLCGKRLTDLGILHRCTR